MNNLLPKEIATAVKPILDTMGIAPELGDFNCDAAHGTDVASAKDILANGFDLKRSNKKPLMGPGAYFFEDMPSRPATDAAEEYMAYYHAEKGPPKVLRASLTFHSILDLIADRNRFYRHFQNEVVKFLSQQHPSLSVRKMRALPYEVLNHLYNTLMLTCDGIRVCLHHLPKMNDSHNVLVVRGAGCLAGIKLVK